MVFDLSTIVVKGTDYIGSCNPNYHTIMTTTAPRPKVEEYIYQIRVIKKITQQRAIFQKNLEYALKEIVEL